METKTTQPSAPTAAPDPESWSVASSKELYRTEDWGMGYFSIADNGHLVVNLDPDRERVVDLYENVRGLDDRGISSPVCIGFPDLLAARMQEM